MTDAPCEAMVLAAGFGSRMRPLTEHTPKPLINVCGKALLDYSLDLLADAGIERAVVNVHYHADQIEAHLAARERPRIIISDEREMLLETGGGLKKALSNFTGDALFCTNTDAILVGPDGGASTGVVDLAAHWRPSEMDALLLLTPRETASGYAGKGDFDRDPRGRIAFRSGADAPYVFTGLQIIAADLVAAGPEGRFSTKALWDMAISRGRLYGLPVAGEWLHVGDPQGLADAEERLAAFQ